MQNTYRLHDKAAVFTGWKEMSEYMAENKIEAVPPTEPVATTVAEAPAAEPEADAKKPAKAGSKKH